MNTEDLFKLGMDREVRFLHSVPRGFALNLGAGNKHIEGAAPLDLSTGWNANRHPIPYADGTVALIYAFHFLEHVDEPLWVLQECQRVMCEDALMYIVVPYGTCHMAVQDLTHQHFFNEDTWKELLRNPYYDTTNRTGGKPWKLEEVQSVIMGVVGRNLALMTQLRKVA